MQRDGAGARSSALAAAWARRENRVAAGVTLVVALAVLALSRAPLEPGFALDLRAEPRYELGRLATFIGFEDPSPEGRALGLRARIVMNRPLPRRFDLELEGLALPRAQPLEIRVGGARHGRRFGTEQTRHRIRIENPGGARAIEFMRPGGTGAGVRLVRVEVREAGS